MVVASAEKKFPSRHVAKRREVVVVMATLKSKTNGEYAKAFGLDFSF